MEIILYFQTLHLLAAAAADDSAAMAALELLAVRVVEQDLMVVVF
jgi:hypothetical protein